MDGSSTSKWILWDIGGVLVELDSTTALSAASAESGLSEARIRAVLREELRVDPAEYSLTEKAVAGQLSGQEYLEQVSKALDGKLEPSRIRKILGAILRGTDQRVINIVRTLGNQGVRQACMSNVDEVHWQEILRRFDLSDLFEVRFLSFAEKSVKPKPEAFRRVLEMWHAQPGDVIFVDDRADNVNAAIPLGLDGIVFTSPTQLIAALHERRLPVLLECPKRRPRGDRPQSHWTNHWKN
jgi:putative hydrolase of the HAD superfamily